MKFNEYLKGVNTTWNKGDGMQELAHCRLAIIEEIGEIAGWYKKHIGYGKTKDDKWKVGIKGEFGDLLFYLSKTAEISNNTALIEIFFEDDFNLDDIIGVDYVGTCATMMKNAIDLSEYSIHTDDFADAISALMISLRVLIDHEGYELEDIQISNLSKLQERHGDSFNAKSIMEEGRDRAKEDEALT